MIITNYDSFRTALRAQADIECDGDRRHRVLDVIDVVIGAFSCATRRECNLRLERAHYYFAAYSAGLDKLDGNTPGLRALKAGAETILNAWPLACDSCSAALFPGQYTIDGWDNFCDDDVPGVGCTEEVL